MRWLVCFETMRLFLTSFLLDSSSVSPTRDFRKVHAICTTFYDLSFSLPSGITRRRWLSGVFKISICIRHPSTMVNRGVPQQRGDFAPVEPSSSTKSGPSMKSGSSCGPRPQWRRRHKRSRTLNHVLAVSRYRYCPKTISTNSLQPTLAFTKKKSNHVFTYISFFILTPYYS